MICECCGQEQIPPMHDKLKLSGYERELWDLFVRRKYVRFEVMEEELWGNRADGGPLSTDVSRRVYVSRLRNKLLRASAGYTIRNVYGRGYFLEKVG